LQAFKLQNRNAIKTNYSTYQQNYFPIDTNLIPQISREMPFTFLLLMPSQKPTICWHLLTVALSMGLREHFNPN